MHNNILSGKPDGPQPAPKRPRPHDDDQPSYALCAVLGLVFFGLLFASLVYVLPEIV